MNPMHTGSVLVLLLVPFVVLFGDIDFNGFGRFGLGVWAYVGLCVAWLVGTVLAVTTARDAGARPAQVWVLVVLDLVALLLGGAAAA